MLVGCDSDPLQKACNNGFNRCRKRILFICGGDRKRKTIRLGKASMKDANKVKEHVEELVAATIMRRPPDDRTSRWVAELADVHYCEFVAVGLAQPRESLNLGPWLESYLAGRTDLKPGSRTLYDSTRRKLVEYFGADRALRTITANDAAQWREKLQAEKLSTATVNYHVGNAKGFFARALKRKLVTENPFADLQGGAVAAANDRYVTPDEAAKIIDALPSAEFKLLFGLARYAGLRVPSESHLLAWADVDFERARLTVRSPKTERHKGHEQRVVPITPKLMVLLQNAFAEAEEGQERLVRRGHQTGRRRWLG